MRRIAPIPTIGNKAGRDNCDLAIRFVQGSTAGPLLARNEAKASR